MEDEDKNNRKATDAPDLSRRRLLRLGLALPLVSASVLLPSTLWAAGKVNPVVAAPVVQKGPAPLPEEKPVTPRLLMIDPGHGGHDPGAVGLSGTKEKDVALDIALRMADEMSKARGIEVRLTREKDVFLPLSERGKIARAARADFFISIHADSAPNRSARGLSAYTLSEKASDQFASMLADKENKADIMGGIELPVEDKQVANILLDLTARHTRNTAQRVKVGFIKGMGRRWELLEEPMRSANFAVLRLPDVPAMLVETGFLSNKTDENMLRLPEQRAKIAKLMVDELSFLLQSPLFG